MPRFPKIADLPRRGLLLVAVLVFAILAGGYIFRSGMLSSPTEDGPVMYVLERADFIHEITERGNVESSKNIDIRCEVKSKGGGGTTILEVIPEGSIVKKGDILAKLDSSALEIDRTNQLIICSNSEAALIQAKKAYETAVIAKREYLEGQYQQAEQTTLNEIFIAQEELSKAEEYVKYSEQLASQGYIPQQQLEADRFAVDKASNSLDMARTKLKVLRDFTKRKMEVQLESDIKTAEAKLKAQEASHTLDMAHLEEIGSQIAKCTIEAPQDGQVVYANVTNWHGAKQVLIDAGEIVRERQTIFRMPDSNQMNVLAKISEGNVTLVSPGMSATVRLDAFPGMELRGTVQKVDEFPMPTSFFGSSVKEYETTIQIDETPPGLRPGLTAEVRILVDRKSNVVQAPVQSVFEHGDKYYCVTVSEGRFAAREVRLGSTNDKTVVIDGGLSEGESIVFDGAAHRSKVDLPELPTVTEQVATRAARHPTATETAVEVVQPAPARHPTETETAAKVVQPAPAIGAKAPADDLMECAERLFAKLDKDSDGKLRVADLPEKFQPLFQGKTVKAREFDRDQWTKLAVDVLREHKCLQKFGAEL